jgi:polar amino acid transport system permease protein
VSIFKYLPDLFAGLGITTLASIIAFALALVLGIVAAIGRQSRTAILRLVAATYIEVIRNTPVLVQIFVVFFGLPAFGVRLPAFWAGVLALAINGGAYLAEIIRAGLRAVPGGQTEVSTTLGLSPRQTFGHVIFPQAIRFVYPPIVNEFIQIILATSLLSTIALNELTGATLIVNALSFQTMEVFTIALILYLLLSNAVSYAAGILAKRAFQPPLESPGTRSRRSRLTPIPTLGGTS